MLRLRLCCEVKALRNPLFFFLSAFNHFLPAALLLSASSLHLKWNKLSKLIKYPQCICSRIWVRPSNPKIQQWQKCSASSLSCDLHPSKLLVIKPNPTSFFQERSVFSRSTDKMLLSRPWCWTERRARGCWGPSALWTVRARRSTPSSSRRMTAGLDAAAPTGRNRTSEFLTSTTQEKLFRKKTPKVSQNPNFFICLEGKSVLLRCRD